MCRSGQDSWRRWWHLEARKRLLAAGLSLTLVGASHGAPGSAGGPEVPAGRASSLQPATPAAAEARAPAADGTALTGTILANQAVNSRAIITDGRGRQGVYARGDEIADGGEVVEIQRDFVLVRRSGRLETLEFEWNSATRKAVSPGGTGQATSGISPEALRHEMFTRPDLLLQLVGASAVVEGGQFRGYRVMQPEDPGFIESLGLKPGDILTGVNGVPFTPDYGAQVLDALSGSGMLTYTVRRGGQVLVVSE